MNVQRCTPNKIKAAFDRIGKHGYPVVSMSLYGTPVENDLASEKLVYVLQETIQQLVRIDTPDLSARQMAILLACRFDQKDDLTVRGLSERLRIKKPPVTRSVDRLQDLGLVTRKMDPRDRRSILIALTGRGEAFLSQLREIMAEAAAKHTRIEETVAA